MFYYPIPYLTQNQFKPSQLGKLLNLITEKNGTQR